MKEKVKRQRMEQGVGQKRKQVKGQERDQAKYCINKGGGQDTKEGAR
jgi:hypothetical protein